MLLLIFRRILLKFFIRETRIYDIKNYPNYELLETLGIVKINTKDGLFFFHVKIDNVNECATKVMFGFSCKRYTVELEPVHDNKAFYRDKIMLTIKMGSFKLSNKFLISFLIDSYLDELYDLRNSENR